MPWDRVWNKELSNLHRKLLKACSVPFPTPPPLFESCRPEKSQTRCPLLQPHDSPCATQPPSSTSPHWTNFQLFLGPRKPLSFVGYQRRISGALVATHQRSAGRGTGKRERQWEGTESELLRRDPNNRAAPRSPFWRVEFGRRALDPAGALHLGGIEHLGPFP